MNKTEMKKVIVGCEPTGCYWLTFQKFLQDHDIQLVTVNPFTVNRSILYMLEVGIVVIGRLKSEYKV